MEDWALLSLIAALLLLLLGSLVGVALHSGLCAAVVVRTGSPPVRGLTVAYKYCVGPYRQSGRLYTEAASIAPTLRSIGVYYDDPAQVSPDKTRYAVGSILSEGGEAPSEDLCKLFEKFGFRIVSFPEVTHVVKTTFPYTTFLSIFLAIYRVGPALGSYIKERKLCAHPWVEIYWDDVIHYFCPLAKQVQFYVPEMEEAARQQREEAPRASDEATGDTSSEASSFTCDSGTNATRDSVSTVTRDSVSTVTQGSESQAFAPRGPESESGDRKEEDEGEDYDEEAGASLSALAAAAALAASIGAVGKAARDADGDDNSDRSESGASGSSFEEITGEEDGDKTEARAKPATPQKDTATEPPELPEVLAEL
ncbi:LOW QUALITY PROTEIN: testis-expressed protein 264 [Lethenteron reissneri]|uniref:LOW QUALITY PROTEIN: testis-expressed protein 264 n=1 Tax=Lethenteron reissneri TaxID=7753 RepID=UPI002AB5E4B0|nr:LOW QUALITY PROTEIN: testis-expressed protein 264 [Lethenteron reissneri]